MTHRNTHYRLVMVPYGHTCNYTLFFSQEGLTALMMATKAGQTSIVQTLLQSGHVDVNAQEKVS